MVVKECVGDRGHGPHAASLLDIDRNYGDLISKVDAINAFSECNFERDRSPEPISEFCEDLLSAQGWW